MHALSEAILAMPASDPLARHRATVRARLQHAGQAAAGHGSISWTINREMIVVAGWGRAILLQLAHPSVAAAVHHHSTFRGSLRASVRRLHATVGAMLSITFGDTEQMVAAAAGINAIHDRIRPPAPGLRRTSGEPSPENQDYSAHDPELQRWVHATLLDSVPLAYQRFVAPLTRDQRDRYCAESVIMEPLLGMPAGWLPRNSVALDAYMRGMLAGNTLVVTDTSRALANALLYPPRWRLAWPAFRVLQLLTIGTLPPAIRQAYGFEWRPHDERALARWTAVLRMSRRMLPGIAREWPIARRRVAATSC